STEAKEAIETTIEELDEGRLQVVESIDGRWVTHAWLKQAILLYFRATDMKHFESGDFRFYDKVPVKKWSGKEGVRVVPQAIVRKGAFIESSAVLMPSYVNIGARVGQGSMVDTWATVGSCA